jgi:hypothetical protein
VSQLLDVRLVIEGSPCSCSGSVLRVHAADGRRELRCERCNTRRAVLGDRTTDFILAVCRGYGAPDRPIILRRPQQMNSA